jgi:hypothetical protein
LSNAFVGEYSSLHFAQFAAILQVRNREHQLPPINFDRFSFDGFFFGSVFRVRHHVLHGFALVRVELLLNSRLPKLTWIGRELRIARFTNPQRRDVADSFQDPKAALCHAPSFPHRRKPRHPPDPRRDSRPRLSSRAKLGIVERRAPSPVQPPRRNRTFSLFIRHCAACRPRASLPSCFGNPYCC